MAVPYAQVFSLVVNSSFNSSAIPVPAGESISVFLNASSVTGTTPSFTYEVQWSMDGSTWHSAETPDTFTAITAAKSVCKTFTPKGRLLRLAATVTGTTPSAITTAWVCGQASTIVGG